MFCSALMTSGCYEVFVQEPNRLLTSCSSCILLTRRMIEGVATLKECFKVHNGVTFGCVTPPRQTCNAMPVNWSGRPVVTIYSLNISGRTCCHWCFRRNDVDTGVFVAIVFRVFFSIWRKVSFCWMLGPPCRSIILKVVMIWK